jgi:hypothetical protein
MRRTLIAGVLLLFATVFMNAQERKAVQTLRDNCVSEARVLAAIDSNDSSHLKDTDWAAGAHCAGFIVGFQTAAEDTVHITEAYKRFGTDGSAFTVKKAAEAIVAYIDEHPQETNLRTIVVNAWVGRRLALLTTWPEVPCPKDRKELDEFMKTHPGGCTFE